MIFYEKVRYKINKSETLSQKRLLNRKTRLKAHCKDNEDWKWKQHHEWYDNVGTPETERQQLILEEVTCIFCI